VTGSVRRRVTKSAVAGLSVAIGAGLGAAAGFLWHAPGVLLPGMTCARRQFADEFGRRAARDELLDEQLRELADRQRSAEREQAESIDVTWDDIDDDPGSSLVMVINGSRRPIRRVTCVVYPEASAQTLAPTRRAEMLAPTYAPDGWAFRDPTIAGHPVIFALRGGGRAGFTF
jgi:hypothetical protein